MSPRRRPRFNPESALCLVVEKRLRPLWPSEWCSAQRAALDGLLVRSYDEGWLDGYLKAGDVFTSKTESKEIA